ncbi:hypothetical protein HAX54_048266, partial [Datura stramonium]|nr:hypothetical protein [Datura stramonium]
SSSFLIAPSSEHPPWLPFQLRNTPPLALCVQSIAFMSLVKSVMFQRFQSRHEGPETVMQIWGKSVA